MVGGVTVTSRNREPAEELNICRNTSARPPPFIAVLKLEIESFYPTVVILSPSLAKNSKP